MMKRETFSMAIDINQQLKSYCASRYLIGYSGGRDSHVLLDVLCQLRDNGELNVPLAAVHVNHGFSEHSEQWAEHCRLVCQAYNIPLTVEVISASPQVGESIEAFARKERYALIEPHLLPDEIFLSAHHQRDQAETFLLQLMRGAGLDGLRAMPEIKPFGLGQYLRPLLDKPFVDIERYAKEHLLTYINDNSNNDLRFSRNYIRHKVLPAFEHHFPKVEKNIAQSAKWLSEVPVAALPKRLQINELQKLSVIEKKQRIRSYIKNKIGTSLSQTQTQYVLENHLTAASDKQPQLVIDDSYVVRRYAGELVVTESLADKSALLAAKNVVLNELMGLPLGNLTWSIGEGLSQDCFDQLTINTLKAGQRFHPHNRERSNTVKKLLHEMGVPPWIRPFCFGLFAGDELVAIPMLGVAKNYYQKDANAIMPIWLIEQKFVRL